MEGDEFRSRLSQRLTDCSSAMAALGDLGLEVTLLQASLEQVQWLQARDNGGRLQGSSAEAEARPEVRLMAHCPN